MAQGFEIKVPITVKGGKREGRDIGKEIADQIKQAVGSLGSGGSPTQAIGMGKGKGGVGGVMAAGITKMAGLLGLIAMAISSLDFILKPVIGLLKAILMLLFMPLIPILKPVMMLLGIMAKTLAPIMQKVSQVVDTLMSKTIIPFMLESADKLSDFYVKFAVFFLDLIQIFVENIPSISDLLSWWSEKGAELFGVILDVLIWAGNFLLDKWSVVQDLLTWAGNFLNEKWDAIKKILEWIGEWFSPIWGKIKGALEEAYRIVVDKWQPIKGALETVLGWMNSIIGGFKDVWSSIKSWSPFSIFGFAKGGVVPGPKGKAQLAVVHGGETITPPGQGGSVIFKPTFQFTGNEISSETDIDSMARRASRIMEMELRQRGVI